MSEWSRRDFLAASLGVLAAPPLFAESEPADAITPENRERFAPDTLFLTWQRDPTTTITIQWIGPECADDLTVQYASLNDRVWQVGKIVKKPFPETDLKVHRCELTDLSPGTEYQFDLGPASPKYRFRTMPAKATNTITFVSGGDAGVNPFAIASNTLAAKQEPYFTLLGGDLAYDNGRSPETFLAFLRNYSRGMIDPAWRMVPLISCPGNHEVNGGYLGARDKAGAYLSVFDGFFAETTYGVLDVGDYLSLVLLDTNHLAPVAGAQTDWLSGTLAARQDRPHLIVANHVPAYPSVRNPLVAGADQRLHWSPLFEKYLVDIVLEHHDHAFKRTHPMTDGMQDKHGVLYLGDGSWGKLRTPNTPEKLPYLAAVSEAYHVTVHRLEGDQRFHVALDGTGKIADVCRTVSKRPTT